jgi:hypothetical protein
MTISVAQNKYFENLRTMSSSNRGWTEANRSFIWFRRRNFCSFDSKETSINIIQAEDGIRTSNIENTWNPKTPVPRMSWYTAFWIVKIRGRCRHPALSIVFRGSWLSRQRAVLYHQAAEASERVYCRPGRGALPSPTEHAGKTGRSVIFPSSFLLLLSQSFYVPFFRYLLSFTFFHFLYSFSICQPFLLLLLHIILFVLLSRRCSSVGLSFFSAPHFTLWLPVASVISSFNFTGIFPFFRVNK